MLLDISNSKAGNLGTIRNSFYKGFSFSTLFLVLNVLDSNFVPFFFLDIGEYCTGKYMLIVYINLFYLQFCTSNGFQQ